MTKHTFRDLGDTIRGEYARREMRVRGEFRKAVHEDLGKLFKF